MEEEQEPKTKEEKAKSVLQQVKDEREAVEKLLTETREERQRLEELHAERLVSGEIEAGKKPEEKPKEETPLEFAERILPSK